jgi:5,10-methenyltetrahydrofolate synthetase
MNAVEAKREMRKRIVAMRDSLEPETRARYARAFVDLIAALPEYRSASSVLTTMAIGSEWDTGIFIARARADGKAIVLPRITTEKPKRLQLFEVPDLATDLKPGVWDIPEPDPARCRPRELAEVDFALVPALAIDPRGYRLGYGAGFFDKLLAGRGARPYCVTALPSAFHFPLHAEPHDVPVDLLISEHGAITRTS